MPPQGKKKDDKKQEEDIDLSTLPPWTAFFVLVEWHPFISDFKNFFNTSQFTNITRDELIAHAKEKGFWVDNADDSIAPELLGRAFREKVFTNDILNRKLKKEKILKIEQAEKTKQEAIEKGLPVPDIPVPVIDNTKPDIFYLVSGYPQTADEAEVLGKLGYGINLSLYVKPEKTELAEMYDNMCKEFVKKLEEGASDQLKEPELPPEFPTHWKALQNAFWKSPKGSPLRNLMTLIAEFKEKQEEVKEEVKEEPQDDKKKRRSSKQVKLGKRVVEPASKEEGKKAEPKAEDKKKEENKKKEEIKKPENAKKAEEDQKKKAEEDKKKAEEEKKKKAEDDKKKAEEEKKKKADEEKKKKEDAKGGKDAGKQPKEEEKVEVVEPVILDPKQIFVRDLGVKIAELGEHFIKYNNWKDVILIKPLYPISSFDVENSILQEQQYQAQIIPPPPPPVDPKQAASQAQAAQQAPPIPKPVIPPEKLYPSYDDAPKVWDNRVYTSLIHKEDENCAGPEYILACMLRQLVFPNQILDHFYTDASKVMSTFYKEPQNPLNPDARSADIYDGNNSAAASSRNKRFPMGDLIQDIENKFIKNLRVPGTKRYMMPDIPQKSQVLRDAERCEIYPFSSLEYPELERALLITKFEQIMAEFTGCSFDFSDREYTEKMNELILGQTISKALISEPDIITGYYQRDDSLLLALQYKILDGRSNQRVWEGQWRVRPNFHQWHKYFKDVENVPAEFYDIFEGKVGPILEKTKLMFPTDGSVFKIKEYAIGPTIPNENQRDLLYSSRFQSLVYKDNTFLGIRKGKELGEFWARLPDSTNVLVEIENSLASMTITQTNGLHLKLLPSGDIIQELTPSRMRLRISLSKSENALPEINRVITLEGTIIRYMKDKIQLLFANGNFAEFINDLWIITNNKGYRISKDSQGNIQQLDSIPCLGVTDPETKIRTIIREDSVKIVEFPTGEQITEHSDGTKYFISPDKSEVLIESPGYCPINLYYDGGFKEYEIHLPDESIVKGRNGNECWESTFYASCLSVVFSTAQGQVALVTGETKTAIEGEELSVENEILNKRPGILMADCIKGTLSNKDDAGNFFEIDMHGGSTQVMNTPPPPPPQESQEIIEQPTEIENLESPKLEINPTEGQNQVNQNKIVTRLFVIFSNGEGFEMLNQSQIDSFCLTLPSSTYQLSYQDGPLTYFTYLRPISLTLLQQGHLSYSPHLQSVNSKIASYIKSEPSPPHDGEPEYFIYRGFIKHPQFSPDKREEFLRCVEDYQNWKAEQMTVRFEFGVEDVRNESVKALDFSVKKKILELRKEKPLGEIESADSFRERMIGIIEQSRKNDEEDKVQYTRTLKSIRSESFMEDVPATRPIKSYSSTVSLHLEKNPRDMSYHELGFLNYFDSPEGIEFSVYNPMPERPPSPPKELVEINPDDLPPEEAEHYHSMKETLSQMASVTSKDNNLASQEASDNPFIALEPEKSSTQKYKVKPVILKPVTKPSCFAEVEKLQILKEEAEKEEAQEYVLLKTNNFDVYGQPREIRPTVHSIRSTSPVRVPNEKFILTESATDRRIRTISQSGRPQIKAPTVQEMRREGTHTILYKALMKKQSYREMIDTQNMMITAFTADPLKRNLQVIPASVRFGVVKDGEVYEMQIVIKNEDNQLLRFTIRQPPKKNVKIVYKPTPIAPGMTTRLIVELNANHPEKVEVEFEVATKAEIYKIPIFANVVNESEFDAINDESLKLHGRGALKPNVRVKGQAFGTSVEKSADWGETSGTDINLPKLPKLKSDIKIDPEKSLKDMIRSRNF
ncbi:unnamed protein product [Blepharisma stoltei]|uniref:Sperm-associated antigen 17 n=1 Tax=Blepharisma stoltei TaxID=1481888 RepID=A0AAU9JSI0_9CILI|nr:unnamed protein product [Blepharisma stoltei]